MNKPVLVVMAAGMGSRYGGMKQIDPVGPNGQVIMDYSLYDARRAGFETVIFVIKHEIEDAFKAAIGDRVAKAMKVKYAFQQLEELPAGFAVPEGRVKPWGTCHAVLAAKPLIDGPFAVINADDYYGPEAFQVMYDYLSTHADDDFYRYCMVSYLLKNTLSENGSVARPALGVKIMDVTDAQTAAQLGVNAYGVYIVEVVKGGPADKAGLQAGDRIVSVDGSEVATQSDLGTLMQKHAAGDTLSITIAREGQMQTVNVTLGEKTASNS